ncbi:oligogalacturonate lyase family protein [Paenibacillus ginsengarvi]|uniref:Oligogalacturonate lyase domain-containing protein n=1 Tax=Paenibacillus ginsengarvi TaxID=400777 RepID=A0A3B0CHX0_9BACL|nr:oligogalacturonate lyase family protein [Paenibacillus ginsengarvi]RKN83919.1 hypothetical protein D7M11_15150 [Paenibacillus ginsengarvi]
MARGQLYSPERKFLTDSETGVSITKLTAFPTVNMKLYFHVNAFTPDSKTLVFHSYKASHRDSQIDIFRVDTDGMNLIQVTDRPGIGGDILSYCGKWLYFIAEGAFRRVSLATFEEEVIAPMDEVASAGLGSLTFDDRYYVAEVELRGGGKGIVRISTDGREADIVYRQSDSISHTQVEPSAGGTIAFQRKADGLQRNIWLLNADGSNLRPLELPHGNGHWMWLGSTKRIMSNLSSEHRGIAITAEGEEKTELYTGEHFWHGSCSMDGKWIVSDTNWPDHGIQLMNVATKKYKMLCRSDSSSGHPQWSHPHPSFSPDGRWVAFNSDRTGMPNVYLAAVPEEMLAELAAE